MFYEHQLHYGTSSIETSKTARLNSMMAAIPGLLGMSAAGRQTTKMSAYHSRCASPHVLGAQTLYLHQATNLY